MIGQRVRFSEVSSWQELLATPSATDTRFLVHPYRKPPTKSHATRAPASHQGEERAGYQRFEKNGRIWYSRIVPGEMKYKEISPQAHI